MNKLNVLNQISSFNKTLNDELDRYVGGVYAKVKYDDKHAKVEFVNSTRCEVLFPDVDENLKNVITGYSCPDTKDFLLQGDSGSKIKNGPDSHSFNFVVHSC